MARLEEVTRESVAEELRDAFDALVADSGGNVPLGPGAVAALSPEMALRRRPLSNYVRWELTLPRTCRSSPSSRRRGRWTVRTCGTRTRPWRGMPA